MAPYNKLLKIILKVKEKTILLCYLMFIYNFQLSHLDEEEVERLICATCVSRLREATSFRQQVLQCEEKLLRTKLHEEGK